MYIVVKCSFILAAASIINVDVFPKRQRHLTKIPKINRQNGDLPIKGPSIL